MKILAVLAVVAAVAICVLALRARNVGRLQSSLRPHDDSDVLSFDLVPRTATAADNRAWVARYGSGTAVAEFEIHMRVAEPASPSPFAPGSVTFRRVPNANGSGLLRDLAGALGLSEVPSVGTPLDELTCDVSFMGSHLTRGSGPDVLAGSFTSRPPGDWIVGKVFFADGEGEVFLAVNPVLRRGEFLAKDPELATPALREFGRLF
jgi:hypothetical protein